MGAPDRAPRPTGRAVDAGSRPGPLSTLSTYLHSSHELCQQIRSKLSVCLSLAERNEAKTARSWILDMANRKRTSGLTERHLLSSVPALAPASLDFGLHVEVGIRARREGRTRDLSGNARNVRKCDFYAGAKAKRKFVLKVVIWTIADL